MQVAPESGLMREPEASSDPPLSELVSCPLWVSRSQSASPWLSLAIRNLVGLFKTLPHFHATLILNPSTVLASCWDTRNSVRLPVANQLGHTRVSFLPRPSCSPGLYMGIRDTTLLVFRFSLSIYFWKLKGIVSLKPKAFSSYFCNIYSMNQWMPQGKRLVGTKIL